MSDVSIVQLRYFAEISSVDLLDAASRSAIILGSGFQNVQKILFAGNEITSFVVVSFTEIRFTMPKGALDLSLPTRVIVSSQNTGSQGSGVSTTLDITKSASGSLLAIQRFFKILLTRKGSNFFNPSQGTALMNLISSSSPDPLMVRLYVSDALSQVKDSQNEELLSASEMLDDVSVVGSFYDPRNGNINVYLEIQTADGVARLTEVSV